MTQSNQTGELLAFKEATERAPQDGNLYIELDSKYVINAITKNMRKNEDSGYLTTANPLLTKLAVDRARKRHTVTKVKWVKGHRGHERNEGADKLAGEAVNTPQTEISSELDPLLNVSGAKLNAMTQALAYRTIEKRMRAVKSTQRTRTESIVDHMKDCAEEIFGPRPTSEMFWKRIRSKDFSRQARFFLWMTAHDAYMVGNKWLRPSYNLEQQSRAECSHCNTLETMDHILTKCETPGQSEIWEAARTLWEKNYEGEWFAPVLC